MSDGDSPIETPLLATAITHLPAGVLIADARSGGLTVNEHACAIWRRASLREDEIAQLPLAAALRGETVERVDLVIVRGDGTAATIRASAVPLRTGAHVTGAAVVFVDISDQAEARQNAERASRAKDEFLAVLSHELRTPMTTVIGWADYLSMVHGADDTLRGPIEALRASARVQAKLVDDLLDVSRIVSGKLSIRKVETELREIVQIACETLRMSADEKGVALEVDAGADPIVIDGDPDRLQQIVTNLVVNGIKFTPAGGRVSVRAAGRGPMAEIVVEDTGEGISPDFLEVIFERFSQASIGDSRRHTGLGLGLSIVRHIVQRHGGSVAAESEGPGKGARFIVRLPKLR